MMILVQTVMMTSLMNKREREREENHCVWGERERERKRKITVCGGRERKKERKKERYINVF